MSDTWAERASRVLLENYYPARLTLVRGEGCRVFDDEGRSYLDLIGGIAVNSLGHCHPAIVRAIREQCGTLMHVSNLYRNPWSVRLAEELAARVPGTRAFFCNSGAEANEAAIKLVRRHAHFTHGAARHVIISAEASFHGRTFAALTATGQPKYREGFEPLVPGFRYVPYGDLAALEAAVTGDVCAVLLEPIQGESGVRVPPPGYLAGAAKLCADRGALLVLDEVQTGLGRTGTFLACEAEGVLPDVVTLVEIARRGHPARGDAGARRGGEGVRPGHARLDLRRQPGLLRRGAGLPRDARRRQAAGSRARDRRLVHGRAARPRRAPAEDHGRPRPGVAHRRRSCRAGETGGACRRGARLPGQRRPGAVPAVCAAVHRHARGVGRVPVGAGGDPAQA